jgi:hypothetical protein
MTLYPRDESEVEKLMAATASNPKYVVSHSVVCAEVEGEAVLLNVETGIYFGLDEVGTAIWKLLEGEMTTEEGIMTRLLDEYEVDESELRRDVHAFLAKLRENQLVQEADD